MTRTRRTIVITGAALVAIAVFVAWRLAPRQVTVTSGQFPEELVYVRSSDDVVNAGAMFKPPKNAAKTIAILWMHGWGVNFYSPTYVNIGVGWQNVDSPRSPSTLACTTSGPSKDSGSENAYGAAACGA